jgi:uncharacterized protein YabN with tetrapyrrole methylase and pyrophosphatase domain
MNAGFMDVTYINQADGKLCNNLTTVPLFNFDRQCVAVRRNREVYIPVPLLRIHHIFN